MDCASALTPATTPRVTKPRVFDEKPIFVRVVPGVRDRIDALRGEARQGDYVRDLLMAALEDREAVAEKLAREKKG